MNNDTMIPSDENRDVSSTIKTLHLDHKDLQDLPPEVGSLTSLTRLHLECNKLRDLPPEVGRFAHVHVYYLS